MSRAARRSTPGKAADRAPDAAAVAPPSPPPDRGAATLALACFVLSGAAGLVYEVCWIRQASLVFGSTQEALSTVLAVFFLGLAIGSAVFGRVALAADRPLRLYAALEIALAVFALASVPLFRWADAAYGVVYRAAPDSHATLVLARIVIVALILLPPTVVMGGTLPLFVRQFVASRGGVLRRVGMLYGINTLGAALGCIATGAVLLPVAGVRLSVAVAAAANALAAALAASLRLAAPAHGAPEPRVIAAVRAPASGAARTFAALVFVTGFTALAYEVLWTRFATLIVYNTVYTYTVTLTVVLVGIVLGSWLGALALHRTERHATVFGALQVASAVAVLATLSAPPGFWQALQPAVVSYAVLMLPAAVLSGATFPLAVRLAVDDPRLAAAGTGRIAMLNTVGGIVGALAAGFFGLPRLGLHMSVLAVTGVSLAAGIGAWTLLQRPRFTWGRGIACVLALAAWIVIPRLATTRVPADFLDDRSALVDFREGRMSNVSVSRRDGVTSLYVDRLWQGQDRKIHQIVAAHLPMLLHPAPRVLVVGVGPGQTASRFLFYDEVQRVDCVDIEPAVFDMLRAHFDARWMTDPRVRLIAEDGRNHLLHTNATYDLISLEVGQLFRPGTASFYTVDFYRRVRERLAPGGLVSQFVPIAFLTPDAFRGVVASFRDVFPQSTLWYNTAELLLIGVNGERLDVDPGRVQRVLADARVRNDLSYRHWGGADRALDQPHMLLGSFLCGPRGLEALAAHATRYHADRPALDYQTSGLPVGGGHEVECLALLEPRLESVDAIAPDVFAPETLAAARVIQARNLDQIRSNHLLDPVWGAESKASMRGAIEAALRANPENSKANGLMGDALTEANQLDSAAVFYGRAAELRPEDGIAQLEYANALARVNRDPEAIAHYRAAVASEAGGAGAYVSMGSVMERAGDVANAARAYEGALRLDPALAIARERLAAVQARAPVAPR